MEKIKVFTDSASDISFENEKNLDIDMINFNITMGDRSYVSRVDFDNEAFYRLMGTYDGIPLTSQATAYEFQELYKKYYDEGYTDVIGILINREGSATYDNSLMAYKLFLEDYPEELAEENEIVSQDPEFSREYCVNLCDSIWGDLWKAE